MHPGQSGHVGGCRHLSGQGTAHRWRAYAPCAHMPRSGESERCVRHRLLYSPTLPAPEGSYPPKHATWSGVRPAWSTKLTPGPIDSSRSRWFRWPFDASQCIAVYLRRRAPIHQHSQRQSSVWSTKKGMRGDVFAWMVDDRAKGRQSKGVPVVSSRLTRHHLQSRRLRETA